MALREFKLPDPGEGLTEAEIVTWHVKPGDTVKVNDVVVEIETAKSLVELPVPFAGTIGELLVGEGDTVEVGTPIITVDDGKDGGPAPAPAPATREAAAEAGTEDSGEAKELDGRPHGRPRRLRRQADRGRPPSPQAGGGPRSRIVECVSS